MPGEITSALRKIKSQNVNIIDDKAKVCAMLGDLEPSMHKERRRVRLLYETGAIHSIAKAVSNPEGAKLYLSQAVSILTDQADMNAAAAAETVNYFTPLWKLPPVDGKSDKPSGLDTDAIFDMMAKADNEKKARAAQKNGNRSSTNMKSPVYGQRTSARGAYTGAAAGTAARAANMQNNPAFNQPLRKAGRLYGTPAAQQNAAGNTSAAGQGTPQGRQQHRIYGSARKQSASAQTGSAAYQGNAGSSYQQQPAQQGSGSGMFSKHRQTPAWKNIAVKVRQTGGAPQSVSSLTAAQAASNDLCRFYGQQLTADGSNVRRADKLCKRAVLLTAFAPARAVKYFMEAASSGDVAHLSLFGRQILAWQDYLEIETAMGFACLQIAVDRGAECGAYALAHCYHTGTGILKCDELAEKYYRQAASKHPEITNQVNRRIDQLHRGQNPTDTLWRYY